MIFTRHGEVWLRTRMPVQILNECRRFVFARPSRKYIFCVVGLHTDGRRQILEAMSMRNADDYRVFAESLPLTINYHTHTATGVLAPRFGLWRIQYLAPEYRGLFCPPQAWQPQSNLIDYATAKRQLAALLIREKRKHVNDQRIFRLSSQGPVTGKDADSSYHIPLDYINNYFV